VGNFVDGGILAAEAVEGQGIVTTEQQKGSLRIGRTTLYRLPCRVARVPGSFLNDTKRERLRGFPAEVPSEDLIGYFTLSERDQLLVQGQRRTHTASASRRSQVGYISSRNLWPSGVSCPDLRSVCVPGKLRLHQTAATIPSFALIAFIAIS
jgi:hypothetical protein